jgi:hypothetical protein
MLRASAEQIDIAHALRKSVKGKDQEELNHVIHSSNPDPQYGQNPYAGHAGKYDPKVTTLLKDVANRNGLPTTSVDLVEMAYKINDLAERVERAVNLLNSGTAHKD